MTARARLVVMASGSGSNLQALIDASASGRLPADVVAVISDQADAYALTRADHVGITARLVARLPGERRTDYDARLAELVRGFTPDYVVLAGWMRLLTMSFLAHFPERVVNLHPARPGELPGIHAIERSFAEGQAGQRTSTGVMVHLVPDEGIDDGPVLATVDVPIQPTDTVDTLAERVHATEHALLVQALTDLCQGTAAPTATRS